MMKHSVVMFALALLLGAGVGFAVGRNSAEFAGHTKQPAAPQAKVTVSPAIRLNPSNAPDATALTTEEAKQRLLAWREAGCPRTDEKTLWSLVRTWSETDPQAVLVFIQTAPRFPRRITVFAIPLAAICRDNPAQVADWLRVNLTEAERAPVTSFIIHLIGKANPRQALALIGTEITAIPGDEVARLLDQLFLLAPADALAAFTRFPSKIRIETAPGIAASIAKTDIDAALQWCASLRGQPGEAEAKEGVLSYLAENNPEKAIELIPVLATTGDLAAHAAWKAARTNPLLALQMIPKLPLDQRQHVFTDIAGYLFNSAPDQTVKLTGTYLPSEEAQQYVYRRLIDWRRADPEAAGAWMASSHDPEVESLLAYAKICDLPPAERLARITATQSTNLTQSLLKTTLTDLSPAETSRWITANPDRIEPGFAAYLATKDLSFHDGNIDTAISWVRTLPVGPLQDHASARVAYWAGRGEDFTRTDALIATISDSRLQTGTRFEIFNDLYRDNGSAALKWLATQPLPPEIRANWKTLVSATPANYFPIGFEPR
jgi:hypothetical protein